MRNAPADLRELDADALKLVLYCTDTILGFRTYTPPGGMLVLLVGKFRDDAREALELWTEQRGRQHRTRQR